PAYDLPPNLATRPAAGLDYCFGIFDRERLAAYSWYALRSIEGEHHVGVTMALDALASRGIKRLLSSIETANFASRNACRRMGFESLGYLLALGRSHERIAWPPRAARELGIEFGRRATVADRTVAAGRVASAR